MSKNVAVYNRSLAYIFPLAFKKSLRIDRYWSQTDFPQCLFVDTYLYFEKYPENKYCIYFIYIKEPVPNPIYNHFELVHIKSLNNFKLVDTIGNYHIYCLEVLDEFKKDYDLLLEGKFSKISDETKVHILKFNNKEYKFNSTATSDLFDVLYKTEKRKKWLESYIDCQLDNDAELASILDFKKETLTLEKIYESKLAGYRYP
jgi:hypothetical protein